MHTIQLLVSLSCNSIFRRESSPRPETRQPGKKTQVKKYNFDNSKCWKKDLVSSLLFSSMRRNQILMLVFNRTFCQKLSPHPQSEFVKEGVKRGSDKIVGASSTASSTDGSNIAQKTERLRLKWFDQGNSAATWNVIQVDSSSSPSVCWSEDNSLNRG